MARNGPAIIAGPTIASSRGGSPFGVRIGPALSGAERISSFPQQSRTFETPRGASLNNFLKAFIPISRLDQIGFKPLQPRGFETVKPLGDLPNRVPTSGGKRIPGVKVPEVRINSPEVKSNPGTTIDLAVKKGRNRFSVFEFLRVQSTALIESAKPAGHSEVVKKAPEIRIPPQTENLPLRYPFAHKIRSTLARLRTNQTLAKSEVYPKTESGQQTNLRPANFTKTELIADSKPASEAKAKTPNAIKPVAKVETTQPGRQPKEGLGLIRRYIGRDFDTNSRRLQRLMESFNSLISQNPGVSIAGAALAKESLIGSTKSLRSRLLEQRGYTDREDGSQKRIELALINTENIAPGRLEELLEKNTAVEATDRMPSKLANEEEVVNVLTPPNSPVAGSEPVVTEQIVKLNESRGEAVQVIEISNTFHQSAAQVNNPAKTLGVDKQGESAPNILQFSLDNMQHNNIVAASDLLKRRQLVLAA